MMAKYNDVTAGQVEACINRMDGWDNFLRFIGGQGRIVFEAGSYELYRHEKQSRDGWIKGVDLENYLRDSGLLGRALSLDSELVKGWIAHPETYPEELKGIYPCLWGSAQNRDGNRNVPYLIWLAGRVYVYWLWVGYDFDRDYPALLASSTLD